MHWTPPSPNRYKINMDGVVFKEQKMVGVVILIRDEEGRLIGACSKKIEAPLGAIEAEAKAVDLGLQFAKVAALVYSLVDAAHSFQCVDFSHVGQNGNRLAHLLARHALGIANLSVWVEETSCFLEQALNQDVFVNSSN
ncbi:uncharacterized protein LOC126727932 [Quercus robur]|uniref:uncharacterized protein LOC126727932 n=1 Tax=Quercus robur TaxID=38942 RepID=UPI002163353B|nr:uncharacterized protein LOC126727932 [Quercus robur]